tara:strand:+ start:1617 stop:1841 length:225 start_codon:yes stop_codon:yes gene_type:complete
MTKVKKGWRKTTEVEQEAFEYLNELRDQGHCNMFRATPFMEHKLGLTSEQSRALLLIWMRVFNEDIGYETIPIQ